MDGDDGDVDQMDYPKYARPATPEPPAIRHRIFGKTTTKLGAIATRTSLRIKQLASYEVNIPPPREILAELKHIIPGASHKQESHTSEVNKEEKTESGDENKQKEKDEVDADRDQKLKKILAESNEVLATANTVFPFTLFPDSVVLDRTKVTITRRNFFFSSEVMSMRIDDILNVTTSVGPFLGSVTLAGRVLSSEDHFTIVNFWRHDAIHLKHIIQGYIIARHNNIDCEHLGKDELISTLTKLGHDTNN